MFLGFSIVVCPKIAAATNPAVVLAGVGSPALPGALSRQASQKLHPETPNPENKTQRCQEPRTDLSKSEA